MDKIDAYIDRVQHLPPAPTVAVQLLGLFSDPDRDIDRIVELISHDPALTAATLKRCNSADLGGAEPTADMFQAICSIGLYEAYCVVAALVASRTMSQVRAKYSADATRLWQHTVTTAVIAAVLARRVDLVDAEAFTAGLLHDIGKLIFITTEGTNYAELVRQTGVFGPALAAAEESSIGFTHADLGARLLSRWSLPENICLAVKHHHQSPTAAVPHQLMAAAVNLGNLLAHQIIDVPKNTPAAPDGSPEAMALLALTAEDIPDLMQEIQKDLEGVQALLQMPA
jgi:putative nucleotidyltransferase with HDIG domain